MKPRYITRLSLLAAAVMIAAGSAFSQVSVGLAVRFGPPAPRHEYVGPAPFHHAVWVRGHWAWDPRDGRYEWVRGRWIEARPSYVWYDGGWDNGPHGWLWRDGYWGHPGAGSRAWARDEHREYRDRYADRDRRDEYRSDESRDRDGGRGRRDR